MGKIFVGAFAALLGMAGVAQAGGSLKDTPIEVSPAVWTGFYVGVHAGVGFGHDRDIDVEKEKHEGEKVCVKYKKVPAYYDWNKRRWIYKDVCKKHDLVWHKIVKDVSDSFSVDDDDRFFLAGLHAGYQIQRGKLVFGIEGDIDRGRDINYLASARLRLGLAHNDWLFFVTGGWAVIDFENDYTISGHGLTFTHKGDEKEHGWVIGGGFDKKISPNLSFGLEGLYYAFDDVKDSHHLGTIDCGHKCYKDYYADVEKDLDFWAVRARISYHFTRDYEPLK